MDGEKEKADDTAAESALFAAGDWAELTQECLLNVLYRLSLEDRWRGAMRVCKAWRQACEDPYLNSVLDLESHFDSASELPRFWTAEFERRVDNTIRSVAVWGAGSLTDIRVRHCSDQSLSLVAERCPNLQVLSIKNSPHVTDAVMTKIASGCPKLRELDISYSYEISHKSIALIGSHCRDLTILKRNLMNWVDPSEHMRIVPTEYLNACPQDGDSEAAAIAKYMPNLVRLELRFLKLTAKGLTLISERCQNLEYIDLSGCVNLASRDITNAISNLKNLKDIKKPNFYFPRSGFNAERYGHWRLYDERFQTDVFRI
ncbi:F-box protein SKIP1 [Striga hermonthica]|uniref:F-box protein SKIP1 n=1 Tax=Striga hermonthica TaxID=68872 RepID=A0A9N7R7D3_STRHE|nr:F-box protein SKIP1 [Striga hermonthica]